MDMFNKKYCRYLKAKNAFGTLEGGNSPAFVVEDANSICWCVKTMNPMGPDNGPVDPLRCTEKRRCYAPPKN